MESKALDFLKSHQSEAPSRFVENAAWRKENASWLRWSRKVALAIIDYMQENGLKRADVAKRLGVSPQYVSKLLSGTENSRSGPRTSLLKALQILRINWVLIVWKQH